MKLKTRNISLPEDMDTGIQRRVRSGEYGNASDVIRAALRALTREEMGEHYQRWQKVLAMLPSEPITPEIEQDIERRVKAARRGKRAAKTPR